MEAALNPEVKNDSKKDERKQRDRENYFLGAYIKKLLDSSDFHKIQKNFKELHFFSALLNLTENLNTLKFIGKLKTTLVIHLIKFI